MNTFNTSVCNSKKDSYTFHLHFWIHRLAISNELEKNLLKFSKCCICFCLYVRMMLGWWSPWESLQAKLSPETRLLHYALHTGFCSSLYAPLFLCIYIALFSLLIPFPLNASSVRLLIPLPPVTHLLLFSPNVSFIETIPEPRQLSAGTQKPALDGFTDELANTWLGGAKRYPGMPFTTTSFSNTAYMDLRWEDDIHEVSAIPNQDSKPIVIICWHKKYVCAHYHAETPVTSTGAMPLILCQSQMVSRAAVTYAGCPD